jgi:hypothetical protein
VLVGLAFLKARIEHLKYRFYLRLNWCVTISLQGVAIESNEFFNAAIQKSFNETP